ncbi:MULTISPECIES: ABC transporter ATP-binding protein [Haloferax]|uniref:Oligopeptide transport ATP-binding protein OppF n=1 Tax=Haloferax massiliensis TaxID=1476858 RepID=A0A0D6JMX1_9EURY|nr:MULTISPECIES: ABC transporter ATP-binding protein [Haloferax]MDS0242523.1 ABC transporter ATP-binding protein [Haloferax sp. S2CR25]MDS0445644.1 ABC transporter ATP-binding protein [Haloferax sp. S2CR25-2]CQR49224.1 Oligopeptide transport ATP-binding protein OppF [Haloferax massiliensis]
MSTTPTEEERPTTARGETILEVNDLKTYYEDGGLLGSNPVKAVDGVSFDIQRGETLGLVGESGCGKSTLGRTLMRLEEATAGEVKLNGTDITTLSGSDLKQFRKDVQMVFQDPDSSLNERMTVGEIVREPLDVHDWKTPSERRERVRELLETVGLQEQHYYRYPHQFSGGQRQRIGIARALALEPEFIILDEPVSALDVSVQAKILNLLEDLQNEFGLTYLFIAHDLAVVRHICDRVAVMYLGNMMEIGPADELFDEPANPYTHALLSSIPEPDPTVERDRITLRGTPPSPRDPPAGCPFSTRCPVKIRPAAYRDMDPDVWERIEVFREVLRERSRADPSLGDRVRELLGRESHRAGMDEIIPELFGDLDVPSDVMTHVREAADYAENDDEDAARTYLREEFGSVCDHERPEQLAVGDRGRLSLCHRHDAEYEEPATVFETLVR